MRLHVLGSSGGYPGPDNPNSGFLLESGETRIWIDAGTGTFSALQRIMDWTRIDAVVISHVHADHCVDLYPLDVALRYRVEGPLRKPLYAPREVWEVVPRFLDAGKSAEDARKLERSFDYHPVDEGSEVEIAGVRFRFRRMDHPVHTHAIRAEAEGVVLTYSADTGPGADLAGFARGSDLLVCEATYQEGRIGAPVHLSARQAAETARRAGARELALTHVWPTFDPERSLEEARDAGEVRVELARPGRSFEIGS